MSRVGNVRTGLPLGPAARRDAARSWGPPETVLAAVLVLLVGIVGGYLLWRAVVPADEWTITVVTDLAFPLVGALALVLAIAARGRAAIEDRTAWAWIALALGAYLAGDILWSLFEITSGEGPDVSIADIGYLLFYPLALVALFRFPGAARRREDHVQLVLDGLTVVVLAGIVEWVFVIGPVLDEVNADRLATAVTLAYPIGDLVLLFAIGIVAQRRRWALRNAAPVLLAAAMVANALGDIASGSEYAVEGFTTGGTPDMFFMLFWSLAAAAAFVASLDPILAPAESRRDRPPSSVMWMPVIAATIGLLLPLLLVATGQDDLLPVAVVGASVMAGLVIARQVVASRSLARAAAEAATRSSEARLAGLVRQVSELMLVVDDSGNVRYASPAADAVAGVAPADLVGRPWLELADPGDRPALVALLSESLTGSSLPVPIRWRLDAGGAGRTLESTAAPLLDDPAGPAVVITCRDVTERLRMEADLEDARRLEAVGRLAGGIAHDFNNLLTAISGYTDILLADAPSGSSERQDLLQIKQAARRGATLTAQMLAVGGREMLHPDLIDVAEVVRSSADLVRGLAGDTVDIVTDLPPVTRRVIADRRQVAGVLRSLVENAADALEGISGPQILTVSVFDLGPEALPDQTVEPSAAGWVVLAVRDTGCGMDASVRAHLFEPFFTTKEPGRGSGLGLASAYGTVRRQGGWIDVATAPGEGTTVRVYWRAADPAAT